MNLADPYHVYGILDRLSLKESILLCVYHVVETSHAIYVFHSHDIIDVLRRKIALVHHSAHSLRDVRLELAYPIFHARYELFYILRHSERKDSDQNWVDIVNDKVQMQIASAQIHYLFKYVEKLKYCGLVEKW